MTIRALWTDFGGVLTEPVAESTERFCAKLGAPVPAYQAAMRAVADELGATDSMAPLDVPLIDQHTWERRMERALAVAGFEVDLSDFPARWFTGRPINTKWLRYLAAWRADGSFVGLLSNMPPAWDKHWRAQVPPSAFDDVVLSFEARCRKPDPAIFDAAAARAGARPRECVLVDDLPANCAGARAAGWQAVLFEDAASAGTAVNALREVAS